MVQADTAACPYQAIQLKVQTDAASVPNTATSAAHTGRWRASGLGVGRTCVGQNRTFLLRPRTLCLGSTDFSQSRTPPAAKDGNRRGYRFEIEWLCLKA